MTDEAVQLLEAAIADTNRRLAAGERRQAAMIEAISEEMRAMRNEIAELRASSSKAKDD